MIPIVANIKEYRETYKMMEGYQSALYHSPNIVEMIFVPVAYRR